MGGKAILEDPPTRSNIVLVLKSDRKRSWIRPSRVIHVEASTDGLRLLGPQDGFEVPFTRLKGISVRRGLFRISIVIEVADRRLVVAPVSKNEAECFVAGVEGLRCAYVARTLPTVSEGLERLTSAFQGPRRYVAAHLMEPVLRRARSIASALPPALPPDLASTPLARQVALLHRLLEDPEAVRTAANEVYLRTELERSKDFLDSVESQPLTPAQRKAVLVDEDSNLVVAAAGSGKTSVIVAKAGHLVSRGFRRPDELLLLAYSRDAAEEMETRLRRRLGNEIASAITVETFHSLGLGIVGAAEGRKPSLTAVAEDPQAMAALIADLVAERMSDPAFALIVALWFQSHSVRHRSMFEFSSQGEYWEYVKSVELRTLKGDLVKSLEECEIANFLFLNRVAYEYERQYEHDTVTDTKKQYQPDFYLSEHRIYLEHFAISRSGTTPPFIDRKSYLEGIRWKRALHRQHQTRLLETYSYEKAEGRLLEELARKLTDAGVTLQPLPPSAILDALRQHGRLDGFAKLTMIFLQHFKANDLSIDALRERARSLPEAARTLAFLDVFEQIHEGYQTKLADAGEIDFADMIAKATAHVKAGVFESRFGYILVDEFQDISPDRAHLVKALLAQKPTHQLFAVGDDWQSIFRFAGSDISVMRQFSDWFGVAERIDLGQTFRCPDRLSRVAADFVLRNPAQLRKEVTAVRAAPGPCVHVGFAAPHEDLVKDVLGKIAERLPDGTRASVLLLGRYRHLKPGNMRALKTAHPGLEVSFLTVHRSKGLEADYVLLLGLVAGRYGFPTEVEDDPLIDLVLAEPEAVANAEERRLFYVALTRARREVFILVQGRPSAFVKELLEGGHDVARFGDVQGGEDTCPACGTGRLSLRRGRNRTFFGCSNFPYCRYSAQPCPRCGTKPATGVAPSSPELCVACLSSAIPCERCSGHMMPRVGKRGSFLGCSNYPCCTFTRDVYSST